MFTLTTPVDPSIMPPDSPPQSQHAPPSTSSATGWKTSYRQSYQPQAESWKTTSVGSFTSPYQQHRQPRPLPHVPSPAPLDSQQQDLLYNHHHRQSMPAGGFMNESFQYNVMNESFQYNVTEGYGYDHQPYLNNCAPESYTSTPSLHQHYPGEYPDHTNVYYQPQWLPEQPYQQHFQGPYCDSQFTEAPSAQWVEPSQETPIHTPPASSSPQCTPQKEKKPPSEKNVRQITVRSVNEEHRVWIDILPTETGLSLAAKIHRIATFGTRKVLKITTTQGRTIPLDHRPIFGSWMDMTSFENGEHWQVEWGSLDRSMVDKFFAKVIQVGGRQKLKSDRKT